MARSHRLDETDAALLMALANNPRATVMALAAQAQLARNTVQSRLARYEEDGVPVGFEHCIEPAALGYPLTAFIMATLTQQRLAEVGEALAQIPEVIEVIGLAGSTDLLIRVVAREAVDLYRIAGEVLAIDGIKRTDTFLSMHRLVDYRVTPLLRQIARAPR
jgi:DNA-binding Lrp family transcriptional regulator